MGFPMIQVFLIAARQVSKPIADAVIRYGKDHPVFRNKLLIPVGRGLVRMTTRLRMKRLGLGEPIATTQISEAAALEQASDFVQQLVLFSYSVGVFAGYYFYTKLTTPDTLKADDFEKYKEQQEEVIRELRFQLETIEQRLAAQSKRSFFSLGGSSSDKTPPPANSSASAPPTPTAPSTPPTNNKKERRFERISSLPIDAAARIILDDVDYVVLRRGTSVGIEEATTLAARGERLRFRTPTRQIRMSTVQICLQDAAVSILGTRKI